VQPTSPPRSFWAGSSRYVLPDLSTRKAPPRGGSWRSFNSDEVVVWICTLSGVTMKARLDGHEFDLEDLADWLPSGNSRVAKDDVGYYLSAAVIDNPPEGKTFYEAAQDLLPIVNGIGSLKSAKFRPVKLDGRYQDGKKRHTVIGAGTIELRSRVHAVGTVTGPDGKVKPQPPPPGIAYEGLTARPEVAEALTILATPAGGGSSCTRSTRSFATP
jgi:hypothetical protein